MGAGPHILDHEICLALCGFGRQKHNFTWISICSDPRANTEPLPASQCDYIQYKQTLIGAAKFLKYLGRALIEGLRMCCVQKFFGGAAE